MDFTDFLFLKMLIVQLAFWSGNIAQLRECECKFVWRGLSLRTDSNNRSEPALRLLTVLQI